MMQNHQGDATHTCHSATFKGNHFPSSRHSLSHASLCNVFKLHSTANHSSHVFSGVSTSLVYLFYYAISIPIYANSKFFFLYIYSYCVLTFCNQALYLHTLTLIHTLYVFPQSNSLFISYFFCNDSARHFPWYLHLI